MDDNPYYEWLTFYNGGISPTTDTKPMTTCTIVGWEPSEEELLKELRLFVINYFWYYGKFAPSQYAKKYIRCSKEQLTELMFDKSSSHELISYVRDVLDIDRYNELSFFGKIKYNLRKWII